MIVNNRLLHFSLVNKKVAECYVKLCEKEIDV